jgi:chemotaxis signal transduction protein
MRRFTVSLPEDLYEALRRRGDETVPPVTLQQMVRHAVHTMLNEGEGGIGNDLERGTPIDETMANTAGDTPDTGHSFEPVDLLVFSVRDTHYGIPIEQVETVAARLAIHPVPTSSSNLVGVAAFRDTLTEVHDGGIVLQRSPLDTETAPSLLAIPGTGGTVLLSVTRVAGLTPAREIRWSDRPASSPEWVAALAWDDTKVVTVVDPEGFNL